MLNKLILLSTTIGRPSGQWWIGLSGFYIHFCITLNSFIDSRPCRQIVSIYADKEAFGILYRLLPVVLTFNANSRASRRATALWYHGETWTTQRPEAPCPEGTSTKNEILKKPDCRGEISTAFIHLLIYFLTCFFVLFRFAFPFCFVPVKFIIERTVPLNNRPYFHGTPKNVCYLRNLEEIPRNDLCVEENASAY